MSKWQEKGSSPKLPSWSRAQAAPHLARLLPPRKCRNPAARRNTAPQTHRDAPPHPPDPHGHSDPPQAVLNSHTRTRGHLQPVTHCHHHHGLTTPPLNAAAHRSQAESHTPGCTTIIMAGAQQSHTLSLPPRGHGSTHPRPSPPRPAADSLGDVQEDVRAAVGRGNEAVALGPTEAFADSFVDRAL